MSRRKRKEVQDDFDETVDIDEDFQRLLRRNDDKKGLWQLLAEEGLKTADLLRVKREYEADGRWGWKRTEQNQRVSGIVDQSDDATAFRASGGFKFHDEPKPRGPGVCEWRGRDGDNNTWWCNNAVAVHGRIAGRALTLCPYHVRDCIAHHPDGPVPLDCPNDSGLCATHYRAEHGHDPAHYDNGFYVPGVVFARPATPSHTLAPHHRLH